MKRLLFLFLLISSSLAYGQSNDLEIYGKIDAMGNYNITFMKSLLDTLNKSKMNVNLIPGFQPLDGDLTAISNLSGTGLPRKTGVNTWVLDGTSFQPLSTRLTEIAALTPSNGQVISWNGTAWTASTPSGGTWGSITGTLSSQTDLQNALNAKQATLVSGTTIKTINSTSLLGSGDIVISGSISDGDKGDITVSSTGSVWTIDNGVVGLAKLAVGSGTAGQQIRVNSGATGFEYFTPFVSPATTNGDIIYYTGSAYQRLGIGTSGQVLTVSGGLPAWSSAAGGVSDGDKGDITVSSSGTVWTIDNSAVSLAKIANGTALSVVGRSANSSGVYADIAAANDNEVLRRSGTSIGFGAINLASSSAVTGDLAFANFTPATAASKLLGRGDSGSGDYQEITIGSGLTMTGTTLSSSGGSLADGDKGDVTVSSSGTVWTIDNNAVTQGKVSNGYVDLSSAQSSIGGNKTFTANVTASSSGGNQVFIVRTSNFASTVTMESILNNTSTEVYKMESNGGATYNQYSTAGSLIGTLRISQPGAFGAGLIFQNSGATKRFDLGHNQSSTNNWMYLYNANAVTSMKLALGGDGMTDPNAAVSITGNGTTTGIALRIKNSANADKFTVDDSGNVITGGSFVTQGVRYALSQKTTTYTLTAQDFSIEVTTGTHTQTLPTAVGVPGEVHFITNSGSGTVTVGTTSSQTFVNQTGTPTTITLNQFQGVMVQSNGTNWVVLSKF